MRCEERHGWSREYALKRNILLILKSPRVAYWRVCGKDAQSSFMQLMKDHKNLQALLDEIVLQYEIMIKEMKMTKREQNVKLNNLHRYAEGKY